MHWRQLALISHLVVRGFLITHIAYLENALLPLFSHREQRRYARDTMVPISAQYGRVHGILRGVVRIQIEIHQHHI